MKRTAKEVIELYNYRVWNQGDLDLAADLLGDTVTRHYVGGAKVLSNAEAVDRIRQGLAQSGSCTFELPLLLVDEDGEYVTIVFEYNGPVPDLGVADFGSMEIYRVVDGRIVEVWNPGTHGNNLQQGRWTTQDGEWL